MAGAPLLPLFLAASTAVSVGANIYGTMQQGAAQQGMMAAEVRARELESKQADLQVKQISAQRLTELNANLGAIAAMRAGRNTLGDSPTGETIVRSFTKESLGARSNEVLDARLRALSARNAVEAANMERKAAARASRIATIGAIADGAGDLYSSGFFRRRPSTRPAGSSGSSRPDGSRGG